MKKLNTAISAGASVLLFTIAIFAQSSGWSPFAPISCFTGFSGSLINNGYVKSIDDYSWNFRIKNNYGRTVHFNAYLTVGTEKLDFGRISMKAGDIYTHTSRYFNSSSTHGLLQVDKVCFADNFLGCSDGSYSQCDSESPNQPENQQAKKEVNAQSGIAANSESAEELRQKIIETLRANLRDANVSSAPTSITISGRKAGQRSWEVQLTNLMIGMRGADVIFRDASDSTVYIWLPYLSGERGIIELAKMVTALQIQDKRGNLGNATAAPSPSPSNNAEIRCGDDCQCLLKKFDKNKGGPQKAHYTAALAAAYGLLNQCSRNSEEATEHYLKQIKILKEKLNAATN